LESAFKAIETTGMIDKDHHLFLDEPLPFAGPAKVRVIILMPEDGDISEKEWLYAAAKDPSFDFLKEPEENIYSLTDGKPFHDER
jgi:hypothetical protein